jgi:hypothetical protein
VLHTPSWLDAEWLFVNTSLPDIGSLLGKAAKPSAAAILADRWKAFGEN